MSDIRQSLVVKDDFNRADEAPLSGGGKWVRAAAEASRPALNLNGGNVGRPNTSSGHSAWIYDPPLDNDDVEAWSRAVGGNHSGLAWGIGAYVASSIGGTNTIDGYLARVGIGTSGVSCTMFRCTNSTFTSIGTNSVGPASGAGWIGLFRRLGTHVQFWSSSDGGVNWTNWLDVVSTTYTTGLVPVLQITEGGGGNHDIGWDDFGSGKDVATFIPQMFRHYRTLRV